MVVASKKWKHRLGSAIAIGSVLQSLSLYSTGTVVHCGPSNYRHRPNDVRRTNWVTKRRWRRDSSQSYGAALSVLSTFYTQWRLSDTCCPTQRTQTLCVLFTKQTQAPYLSEMCQPISSVAGRRHLRSAVRGHLAAPRYRLTTAGRRAFSFAGPSAWNSLPAYLENETLTLDSFKCYLKCFLFDSYWQRIEHTISRNYSALYKCSLIIIIIIINSQNAKIAEPSLSCVACVALDWNQRL